LGRAVPTTTRGIAIDARLTKTQHAHRRGGRCFLRMPSSGRIGRGALAAGLLAALAATFPVALACPIEPVAASDCATPCPAQAAWRGCTIADRHFVPVSEGGCAGSACDRDAATERTTCEADAACAPGSGGERSTSNDPDDARAWCSGDPSSAPRPAPLALDAAPVTPVLVDPTPDPGRWLGVRAIAADRPAEPPPRARPPARAPPLS
jgi:hypothetical protein